MAALQKVGLAHKAAPDVEDVVSDGPVRRPVEGGAQRRPKLFCSDQQHRLPMLTMKPWETRAFFISPLAGQTNANRSPRPVTSEPHVAVLVVRRARSPPALVVEDDELQREILSEFLKDENMDVIQCESAEAAELIIARVGAELASSSPSLEPGHGSAVTMTGMPAQSRFT